MIELHKILVPTDFSDNSKQALKYGRALATTFGAELHLLHVLQDLVSVLPEPGLAFPPPGNYMAELKENAEKALLAVGSTDAGDLTVVRDVRQGPPFLEIIRYARASGFPYQSCSCPNNDTSKRAHVKAFLRTVEKEFPKAKKNLYKAVEDRENLIEPIDSLLRF